MKVSFLNQHSLKCPNYMHLQEPHRFTQSQTCTRERYDRFAVRRGVADAVAGVGGLARTLKEVDLAVLALSFVAGDGVVFAEAV